MKSLWRTVCRRFLLWWYDVCPIHGKMTYIEAYNYSFCPQCDEKSRKDREVFINRLINSKDGDLL